MRWSVPELHTPSTQSWAQIREPLSTPILSPDGRWLAAGGPAGELRLLELTAGGRDETLRPLRSSGVLALAFSPDSRTFAATVRDSTVIHLWEVATGKALTPLQGHAAFVRQLLFSPDGTKLISGDGSRSIKIWDWRSGSAPVTLTGHRAGIVALAVTADGLTLASASSDRTVRLWHIPTGRELLRRDMTVVEAGLAFAPDDAALYLQTRAGGPPADHSEIWSAPALAEIDAVTSPGPATTLEATGNPGLNQ